MLPLRRKRAKIRVQTLSLSFWVFFFQAEDGIRDIGVTGVQTCALPIFEARHGSIQSAPQCGRKRAAVRSRAPRDVRARRLGPDWAGKMAIALMARNHVPMQDRKSVV